MQATIKSHLLFSCEKPLSIPLRGGCYNTVRLVYLSGGSRTAAYSSMLQSDVRQRDEQDRELAIRLCNRVPCTSVEADKCIHRLFAGNGVKQRFRVAGVSTNATGSSLVV